MRAHLLLCRRGTLLLTVAVMLSLPHVFGAMTGAEQVSGTDLLVPYPDPFQSGGTNPSTDCPRIQVVYGAPFAFTWTPESVSATFPWVIGPRAEPASVRLRYQISGNSPPSELLESDPVELPANVGWDPVRLRVSGLLPGMQYRFSLLVTDSRGACVHGDPGRAVTELSTPTNRWSLQALSFGIDRFAGTIADFDGDGGMDFVTVPLSSLGSMFLVGIVPQGPERANNDLIRIGASLGSYRRLFFSLDFSGDGRTDLLFAETRVDPPNETTLVGRLNQGNGSFHTLPGVPIPDPQGLWAVIDVDQDGKEDVLEIGRSNGVEAGASSWWYRSLGNGMFDRRVAVGLPTPMTSTEGAAWTGDADGDGHVDLLLTGQPWPDQRTRVYRNGGDGVFTPIPGPFESWSVLSAAWADFDGDGRAELALCGLATSNSPAFRLYRRNGEGGIVEWGEGWPRDLQGWVGAGDLDADGRYDLVLIGPDGGWWKNLGSGRFMRMPDGLKLDSSFGSPSAQARAWVVDQDGDGDLDIFVNAGWNQAIFRNDMLSARPRVRVDRVREPFGAQRLVLRLSGELGQAFRISYSADLATWTEEVPVVVRTGSLDLQYPIEPGAGRRFLRALPTP